MRLAFKGWSHPSYGSTITDSLQKFREIGFSKLFKWLVCRTIRQLDFMENMENRWNLAGMIGKQAHVFREIYFDNFSVSCHLKLTIPCNFNLSKITLKSLLLYSFLRLPQIFREKLFWQFKTLLKFTKSCNFDLQFWQKFRESNDVTEEVRYKAKSWFDEIFFRRARENFPGLLPHMEITGILFTHFWQKFRENNGFTK